MTDTQTRPAIDLDAVLARIGPDIGADAERRGDADTFCDLAYDLFRKERVFSALVPASLGGGGASHAAMCRFLRGVGRHCPSAALALSMHQHLVAAAVANDRAGRPGRTLLEAVAAGERILVSTGANDWLESNGRATPAEDGWRIEAVKPFASGGPRGDMLVTSAVADPEGRRGPPEVLHFAVPLSAEGVSIGSEWQAMGMRGTGSGTIRLDGVFVPAASVSLRRPQGPFHPAFAVILTVAMPLIVSAYLGAADAAVAIVRNRLARRPEDPTAAPAMGDLTNAHATAEMAWQAMIGLANALDFEPSAELASAVLSRKTIAATHLKAVAEKALAAAGGAGYLRGTGIERYARDLQAAQFHPLPERRQQLFTGRLALGLAPVAPSRPDRAAEAA